MKKIVTLTLELVVNHVEDRTFQELLFKYRDMIERLAYESPDGGVYHRSNYLMGVRADG